MGRLGDQASVVGRDLTTKITLPLVGVAAGAIKASADWEMAMTELAKTVDEPAHVLGQLGKQFQALSREMPTSANELARIGAAAGQLGIKTKNIVGFTETMAALGVATNLSAEEAATSLARLANITEMPQEQFDRLGSVVVDLGNNLATTEREIVEFGLRIAGAGKIAGLTEPQILAIGAAMSSVGIEAEAGGTAVQKVLIAMRQAVVEGSEDLSTFAATAGMSAAEFQRAFEEDAGQAFARFVTGLGKQGDEAFKTLEALNLQDQRLIRSFLSLANAGDLVTESLALGTQAWDENTALTAEAEKFYATLTNRIKALRNQVVNAAAEMGDQLRPAFEALLSTVPPLLNAVTGLVRIFASMPNPVQAIVIGLAALAAGIGPLLLLFGATARSIVNIIALKTAWTTRTLAQIAATNGLTAATVAQNAALAATPPIVTAGTGALAAQTGSIGKLIIAMGRLAPWVTALTVAYAGWRAHTTESATATDKLIRVIQLFGPMGALRNAREAWERFSERLNATSQELPFLTRQMAGLIDKILGVKEATEGADEAFDRFRASLGDALPEVQAAVGQMERLAQLKVHGTIAETSNALNRLTQGLVGSQQPTGEAAKQWEALKNIWGAIRGDAPAVAEGTERIATASGALAEKTGAAGKAAAQAAIETGKLTSAQKSLQESIQRVIDINERNLATIEAAREALRLKSIEYEEGAEAARIATLMEEGFTKAQAEQIVGLEKGTRQYERLIERRQKANRALADAWEREVARMARRAEESNRAIKRSYDRLLDELAGGWLGRVRRVGEELSNIFGKSFDQIVKSARDLLGKLGGIFGGAGSALGGVFGKFASFLAGPWIAGIDAVLNAFGTSFDEMISETIEGLKSIFTGGGGRLIEGPLGLPFIMQAIQNLSDENKKALAQLFKTGVFETQEELFAFFRKPGTKFTDQINKLLEALEMVRQGVPPVEIEAFLKGTDPQDFIASWEHAIEELEKLTRLSFDDLFKLMNEAMKAGLSPMEFFIEQLAENVELTWEDAIDTITRLTGFTFEDVFQRAQQAMEQGLSPMAFLRAALMPVEIAGPSPEPFLEFSSAATGFGSSAELFAAAVRDFAASVGIEPTAMTDIGGRFAHAFQNGIQGLQGAMVTIPGPASITVPKMEVKLGPIHGDVWMDGERVGRIVGDKLMEQSMRRAGHAIINH